MKSTHEVDTRNEDVTTQCNVCPLSVRLKKKDFCFYDVLYDEETNKWTDGLSPIAVCLSKGFRPLCL